MRDTHRGGVEIIGLGIGFLIFGYVILPRALSMTNYDEYNIFIQVVNTYSIGIVYVLFGLVIEGWKKQTASRQIPFRLAVVTAGIAITAIVAVWMFVFLPAEPYSRARTFSDYLEDAAFSPVVWIGWNLAWILAYNFASVLYQRVFAIAGIATGPLLVAVFGLRMARELAEKGGPGSGLGYVAAYLAIVLSIVAIPVAFVYALPFYRLQKQNKTVTRVGS